MALSIQSIDTIVECVDNSNEVVEVRKDDAVLRAQFLYLLGKVFGNDCVGSFPGIYGSESISKMLNGGSLSSCLGYGCFFTLSKTKRNFLFFKSSEDLVKIEPINVGQDNGGAFVKNGVYSSLRITAFSEEALEKSKKFVLAYRNLSGMSVEVVQSYLNESVLREVENNFDKKTDLQENISEIKIEESVTNINELIEIPVFPTVEDLLNFGNDDFYDESRNTGRKYAGISENAYVGVPESLEKCLSWVKLRNGVVASMPYLIGGLSKVQSNHWLRWRWHTCYSEENVGIDKNGKFANKGKPVIVVVHCGGILTPERIRKAYNEGLTPQKAARFEDSEFSDLLEGKLPSGEKIQLYTVDDVKNGRIPEPFGRYAVVITDFEKAKATINGYQDKTNFMSNDLVIARAGTLEYLDAYFENIKSDKEKVGNWHKFSEVDPEVSQGRLSFVGVSCGSSLCGSGGICSNGRFVVVAPEAR